MKITILVKRICLLLSLLILVLLLLLFLIINSPLVNLGLEKYLSDVTGQNVLVGSARLSMFPPLKLVAKGLSITEHGESDPFIAIERAVVIINVFKLLDREISLSQLDIDGCRVLLSGNRDYGDGFLPLSFMSPGNGDEAYEALRAPLTGWEITSTPIHLKNGSIIYTEKEKANGPKKHSIENIHTKASIARDNLVISSFGLSYQDAGITLSGTVNNFLKEDRLFSLEIKGETPLVTVKEFFPEQLTFIENGMRCNLLLHVRGPTSRLDIDAGLNLLVANETPQRPFTPADILLKAQIQDKKDLQLECLKVSAPLGTIAVNGTLKHFLSEGRRFDINHTAALKLYELVGDGNSGMEVEGILLINGTIKGVLESFVSTTHLDLSPLSVTVPDVLEIAKQELGAAKITCLRKENILRGTIELHDSLGLNATLKGEVENILSPNKSFNLDLHGRMLLPRVINTLSGLKEKPFSVQGESPLHIALKGTLDEDRSVKIDTGTLGMLGSEVTLAGEFSNIFSEEHHLSLDTTIFFNAPQLSFHFPGVLDESWGLDIPDAFNLSIQGPLKTLFLTADCDLKGFDFKSPYFSLKEPLADGAVQLEASLVNTSDVDIHTFLVRLKQSQLSLSGRIKSNNMEAPDAYLEASGKLIAEEILPLLQEPLPDNFSFEGTSLLQAVFKGDPAKAFTVQAAIDLTGNFWEDPFLFSKKKGVKNRATFSLSRDYSTNHFEGTGDFALESAHLDFSFRYPSNDPNPLYAEFTISPIEILELTSLKMYQAGEKFGGEIALDLSASINPSHLLESSVDGFFEADDFFAFINGREISADVQLIAYGDRIEVPGLNVQYGDSDLDIWQSVFFWGDTPKIAINAFARSINLRELIPGKEEEDDEEKGEEEVLEDESSDEDESETEWNVFWQLLERKPDIDIDLSIARMFVGHRDVRNVQLLVNGDKGIFNILKTFQTDEGKSNIRAEVRGPFANQCIQESLQFEIIGFNMTGLANLLAWEEPPFTGVVYANGDLIHVSDPNKRWINPENLDGQINIRFEDGRIRELAIITNMLSVMRYPIALAIPIVRWIFLSDVALNWWKRRSITTLSRTMPYDLIEGSFVIDDGLVTTEDLILMGEVLNIAAALTMDMLDENALGGLVVARYYSTVRNLIGWIPVLGDLWIALQDKLIASRFKVSGTLGDPKVASLAWKQLREGTRGTFNVLSNSIRLER
jgi:hypothetical protein